MKRHLIATALLSLLPMASAGAQEPPATEPEQIATSHSIAPTPEMWFYEQEVQRHDDPKLAVRRKAEYRTRQRELRMAAQRWYGYSKARPTVNPTPFGSVYSPSWTRISSRPLAITPRYTVIIDAKDRSRRR